MPEAMSWPLTVSETSTCPGSARSQMRFAMVTVSPMTSSARLLDVSAVDARAYLDSHAVRSRRDVDRGAHGPSGGVERGKESIADRLDFNTSIAVEACAHHRVVRVRQRGPLAMTQAGRLFGRRDDVGEQHRRPHDVAFGCLSAPGQELFDLVENGVVIAGPECIIDTRKFHVLRAVNVIGQVPTRLNADRTRRRGDASPASEPEARRGHPVRPA